MIKLAEEFDKLGINYLWLVFTNDINAIPNKNVIFMEPRLNIRPYLASIKGRGYGVQLSDCEGDCYFTRECEALGLPLLVTPVQSFKEQGLKDGENCYYIPFNIEELKKEKIKKIVNNIPEYEPFKTDDIWNTILVKGKSKYKKEEKIKARAIEEFSLQTFDELENIKRFNRFKNKEGWLYKGDIFECYETMFEYLTIIPNKKPLIERIDEECIDLKN